MPKEVAHKQKGETVARKTVDKKEKKHASAVPRKPLSDDIAPKPKRLTINMKIKKAQKIERPTLKRTPIQRILRHIIALRSADVKFRITREALAAACYLGEARLLHVIDKVDKLSQHAGRKTIKHADFVMLGKLHPDSIQLVPIEELDTISKSRAQEAVAAAAE